MKLAEVGLVSGWAGQGKTNQVRSGLNRPGAGVEGVDERWPEIAGRIEAFDDQQVRIDRIASGGDAGLGLSPGLGDA